MLELKNFVYENINDYQEIIISLANCSKKIYNYISSFETDKHLETDSLNHFNESQIHADLYTNDLIIEELQNLECVHTLASEELVEPILINNSGKYLVCVDPLDGSKNVEYNLNTGTIFTIFRKKINNQLYSFNDILACGYFLYGPTITLVLAFDKKVHIFSFDKSHDQFFPTHINYKLKKSSKIISINDADFNSFSPKIQNYLIEIKKTGEYKNRYIGTLVADLHRTLLSGGIFLYPSNRKYPNGKLRLFFEVFPACYLINSVGGESIISSEKKLYNIQSNDFSKTEGLVFGSKMEIDIFLSMIEQFT